MLSSFFVAFLLELFHFPSMPRWPFGQHKFLNSREIWLCPFCCLNHFLSYRHTLSFLSDFILLQHILNAQVRKNERDKRLCNLRFIKSFSFWNDGREIASSVYLSGEEKADWEIFLQKDGLWCQCLFQEKKKRKTKNKTVCGELELKKYRCGYRWPIFGSHNWGDI